ncbi:TrmH family RNA methyltransferase [Natribacillus halophilus]|uniref:TrmH family RNA methyltransferase n=1 Tax=Natribacillus halophilus TaxID=549003 RepID=UPI00115FFEF5|nr:RNA methyltransferase [Natribacillus halophilus]
MIKNIKKLQQKKYRLRESRFLIEGVHLIEEALAADVGIDMLVKSEEAPLLPFDIGEHRVVEVEASVFTTLSETQTPQGWLAVCKMPTDTPMIEGDVLLLDGLSDPGNVGTIIRTAEAAGMAGIYVSEDTVDLYNDKVIRATQGALFHIPVVAGNLKTIVFSLQEKGIPVYSTAAHAECSYQDVQPRQAYALLLGNEAQGLSSELANITDQTVSIPIFGKTESLNVAVAAGVLMYGWLNQREEQR